MTVDNYEPTIITVTCEDERYSTIHSTYYCHYLISHSDQSKVTAL